VCLIGSFDTPPIKEIRDEETIWREKGRDVSPCDSLDGGLRWDFVGEIRKKPVSRNTGLKRVVEHFKRNASPLSVVSRT